MQCRRGRGHLLSLLCKFCREQLRNLFPCKFTFAEAMTNSKERLYQREIKSVVSSARDLNNNNNNNNNNPRPPYRINALSKISKKPIPHYLKPTATSSSYVSNSLRPKTQKQIVDSKLTVKTSSRSPLLHSNIQKQTSNCTSSAKTSSQASSHSRTQTKASSQNSFLHSKSQKQTSDSSLNTTSSIRQSTPSHHKNHMQKANSWSTVRNSYRTVTKLSETQKKTCPTSTAVHAKSQKQTFNGYSRSRTTPVSKAHPVCFLPQRPSSADSTNVRTRSIPSISSLLSPIKAQSIIRSNSKTYRSSTRMTLTPSTPMILTVIHEEEEEEEEVDDASEKDKESKGGKELEERVKRGRELVDEKAEMVEIEYQMSFSGPFDIRSHTIEQATNKFSFGRQNKVKALAGAFETAISSQKFESRGNIEQ